VPPPVAFFPAAPKVALAAAPPAPPPPMTSNSVTVVTPVGTVQVPLDVKTFSAVTGDGICATAGEANIPETWMSPTSENVTKREESRAIPGSI
jgi:hypothetical protein